MKVLIDISCDTYERATRNSAYGIATDVEKAVAMGTPIPEGATNGEVFEKTYKPYKVRVDGLTVSIFLTEIGFKNNVEWLVFTKKWWNAKYRKVEE